MNRVLIVGGTGFVGGHLCRHAKRIGWEVTSIARDQNIYADFSIQSDLSLDKVNLSEYYDLIIHAAGASSGNKRTADFVEGNVFVTSNLLKSLKPEHSGKMVYLSGISMYQNTDTDVINEQTPVCNPDVYSQTKIIAESLLKDSPIKTTLLRLPAILGHNAPTSWPVRANNEYNSRGFLKLINRYNKYNHCIHIESLMEFIFSDIFLKLDATAETFVLGAIDPLTIEECAKILLGKRSPHFQYEFNKSKSPYIDSQKAIEMCRYQPWSVKNTLKYFKQEK